MNDRPRPFPSDHPIAVRGGARIQPCATRAPVERGIRRLPRRGTRRPPRHRRTRAFWDAGTSPTADPDGDTRTSRPRSPTPPHAPRPRTPVGLKKRLAEWLRSRRGRTAGEATSMVGASGRAAPTPDPRRCLHPPRSTATRAGRRRVPQPVVWILAPVRFPAVGVPEQHRMIDRDQRDVPLHAAPATRREEPRGRRSSPLRPPGVEGRCARPVRPVPLRDAAWCQRGETAFRPESPVTYLGVDTPEQPKQPGQPVPEPAFRSLDVDRRQRRERLVRHATAGGDRTLPAPREGVQPLHEHIIIRTGAADRIDHGPEHWYAGPTQPRGDDRAAGLQAWARSGSMLSARRPTSGAVLSARARRYRRSSYAKARGSS